MTKYFINGGVNNNWGDTSNWSDTSGGAGGFSVPTSTDDVFLDASSPNCNVATLNRTAKSITFTGYVNTINFDSVNRVLTISGNIVFSNTMLITGTGSFQINASASITSNGLTITAKFNFAGALTITLNDDLVVVGNVTMGTTASEVFNGNTFYIDGNLSIVNNVNITGTTNFVLNGIGTISHTGVTTWGFKCNLTINTSGTITLGTNWKFGGATFTYTAGSVITTNSTFSIVSSCTLNLAGIVFNNVTCLATATITNNSLLSVSNNLTYSSGTVITFAGSAGWETANFYIQTSNNISHTLVAGKTYTVTTYFESIATTSSLKDSLISSIPGTKAIFTLEYPATQNVGYTNAVDIDSSLGQTIWTFNGVVTTTNNWNTFTSNSNSQRNYIF